MEKDFQNWHNEKKFLHNDKRRPFFHEREIWFTSLGENIGFEQDGRGLKFLRPVIVLKKFNNEVLWCIPLTKSPRQGKYYFSFKTKNNTSTAILSQIRLVDGKRLQYKVGDVALEDFEDLKRKIRQLLA